MSKEYIIYCDESVLKGAYYSNFYGGVLVKSSDLSYVKDKIATKKLELSLSGEVKWQKVTANYLDKYIELVNLYFDLMEEEKLKTRIMFSQNCHVIKDIEHYHHEHKYFLLYYQFIKHAFGLSYSNPDNHNINLRIYFDKLPDTEEKVELFKDYIHGLNRYIEFRKANLRISREQIAEVESHKHDILLCLDIVLGSMSFRLNEKHKEKPIGSARRGKRTVAKDKLYNHINTRIRKLYKNFNIGVSTGVGGSIANRWNHAYRHWSFKPASSLYDDTRTKK